MNNKNVHRKQLEQQKQLFGPKADLVASMTVGRPSASYQDTKEYTTIIITTKTIMLMKKLFTLLLAVAGMVGTASATDYSIGSDQGGWAIRGQMTANGDGTYSYIINLPANYETFLFTIFEGTTIADGWSNAFRPKGASADWGLVDNNTPTLEKGANTFTLSYGVSSTVARALKVDFTPSTGACTVTRLIAVASGYNQWSTQTHYLAETSRGTNVYTGAVPLEFTSEGKDNGYKFVSIENKTLTYRAYKKDNSGEWLDVNQGNATVSSDGIYTLTANYSTFKWNAPSLVKVSVSPGEYGMATFSSEYALDFTSVSGITAYTISGTENASNELSKTQVTGKVPAETGLYIEGTAQGAAVEVPTTIYTTAVSDNKLVAQISSGTVSQKSGDNTNFILTVDAVTGQVNTPRFFKVNDRGNTVGAGKAYLQLPTSQFGARQFVWFDEATAIEALQQEQHVDGQAYNLAGQRIAKPTKGLYIVNGKKYVNK